MNINLLKAEIAKNGLTQQQVSNLIDMPISTFCRRMKKGVFGIDEATKLIEALRIKNPEEIFFDTKVT